jgi:hypothetical protein
LYFFEEEDQDLDKGLNIFIRVNSGGTVLSYADLLLSIATLSGRVATRGRKSTASSTR